MSPATPPSDAPAAGAAASAGAVSTGMGWTLESVDPRRLHWLDRSDLRLRSVLRGHAEERGLRYTAGLTIATCAIYGLCMGSFSARPEAAIFSAIKVPMLLGVTTLLTLPPLLVIGLLLGLSGYMRRLLVAIGSAQAAIGLALAAVAPYTVLWYTSAATYDQATLFNTFMFGVATLVGHFAMRRATRNLVSQAPSMVWLLRFWVVLYAFVGIQMGWILRPFIGHPDMPVQFFRDAVWDNAYVQLWGIVQRVMGW